jgi:hypothetical protein
VAKTYFLKQQHLKNKVLPTTFKFFKNYTDQQFACGFQNFVGLQFNHEAVQAAISIQRTS